MKYSRFDVIVANFPFIENIENAKARPAVVISSDIYNAETGFVVIAMITSAKHSRLWGDIKISDHKMSELHSGSVIRMKFTNIIQGAILHKLGKLSKADRKEFEIKMKEIF